MLLERYTARCLPDHATNNDLFDRNQSAYRPHTSTETALVLVQNHILEALDRRYLLLDMSATFDHDILVTRLGQHINLTGSVRDVARYTFMWKLTSKRGSGCPFLRQTVIICNLVHSEVKIKQKEGIPNKKPPPLSHGEKHDHSIRHPSLVKGGCQPPVYYICITRT